MPLLTGIGQLAQCRPEGGQEDIQPLTNAALAWQRDRIVWIGKEAELPGALADQERIDVRGRLVTPGLVDCHTHLAFAGWRADEFEQRIRGRSYLEIARGGGGIQSTVDATRSANKDELLQKALAMLDEISRLGVTTVECKSGYGLDLETELKLLEVYRHLSTCQPVKVVPTFLAHTVPADRREARSEFIDEIVASWLPEISERRLARFCDVFLEEGAFTRAECEQILGKAIACGLGAKIHADQLSCGRGAELAGQLGAVSADHLEQISEAGMEALRDADVIAVNLPIASLYLDQPCMPARKVIAAGVRVAVATDFNPGSAPSYDLPLALMLTCTRQKLTPAEALKGASIYAAAALKSDGEIGSLEVGKAADLAVFDAPDVNHWLYHFRSGACRAVVIDGTVVYNDLVYA